MWLWARPGTPGSRPAVQRAAPPNEAKRAAAVSGRGGLEAVALPISAAGTLVSLSIPETVVGLLGGNSRGAPNDFLAAISLQRGGAAGRSERPTQHKSAAVTGPRAREGTAMSQVEAVYLIHHSHTDVGYTHDQPVVWDLYRRFLEQALDLAARDADGEGDHCFRWTVETTAPLLRWLETASPARRRLFVDLCRLGRIEVTAMPVNATPLYDTAELLEALEPVESLRHDLGIPVRHAMQSDVNGENWPLVDALIDAGVEGFTMAINVDHGGAPPGRPNAFLWEGPSGRRLPAWNGWSYGLAWGIGVGHDAERLTARWPRIADHLARLDAPVGAIMLQLFSGFGDNGPPIPGLSAFVRSWNAAGRAPRLVVATPADWWAAVAPHRERLPVWRGDWTDFWNFGAGSSALETAVNRASRGRLETADRAGVALQALGAPRQPERLAAAGTRARAVFALQLWDEHTWGADCSVARPDDEDTLAQWYHKAHYAYEARSLSLMLRRDAVAELARRVERAAGDGLLVFNPSPQDRTVAGAVRDPRPSAQRGGAQDPAAARHFVDRGAGAERASGAAWGYLPPTTVPGFGYTLVPSAAVRVAPAEPAVGDEATVTCGRYRLTFDRERGGVRSCFDLLLGREWVDPTAPWPLHGFVHERLTAGAAGGRSALWSWPANVSGLEVERGWHPEWPAERQGPERVLEHRVERTPVGVRVTQRLAAPGVSDLVQTVTLVDGLDEIAFTSHWHAADQAAPEATYIVFPFALPGGAVRYDVGGQAVRPESDQLPGACRDYFSVQRWVDLQGAGGGVTLACPDTPLWQFGGFSFSANRTVFALERPWLLAWVTNNYWHTNFRASQPGPVYSRFVLRPYAGAFDEAAAHRLGAEASLPPVFHHLGEDPATGDRLPRSGSLLQLPDPPVRVLSLRPDADGSVLLRLQNASDASAQARIGPGLLRIGRAATANVLGGVEAVLPLDAQGAVGLGLGPRRVAAVRLWLHPAGSQPGT